MNNEPPKLTPCYFSVYFSFGRKMIFIISTIFMAITGIGQALSSTYSAFILFAYLNAVGTSGVFPLAFIIGILFLLLFSFCIKINFSAPINGIFYHIKSNKWISVWVFFFPTVLNECCCITPRMFTMFCVEGVDGP